VIFARNGIDLRRADEAARRRRRMMPTLLCVFEQIPLA